MKSEMKEKLQLISQKTKDCKKLLWTTICWEIGQPGWNGHISRNVQVPKLSQEEAESLSRLVTTGEIEAVKKLPAPNRSGPDGFDGKSYQYLKKN